MAKRKARRRKNKNEGGGTSNHPSQREIGGGEPLNPSPHSQEEIGGGREMVTIDTDLLDCTICTYPLCPPVWQCTNGHVACLSCWSNIQYKCHMCTLPVKTRNIALEKVLESVHLSCTNAGLGCCKSVSYSQMQVRCDTCEFSPSLCTPGCLHKAFSGENLVHFLKEHEDLIQEFLEQEEQLTQLQQQLVQLHTSNDGLTLELQEMPELLADLHRRSTEKERQLQNMSTAMHRFFGEPSNPPPQEETGGGRQIVTINTDLLDCFICTNPLCPPLHQYTDIYTDGEVVCPSCWSKLQEKWYLCDHPVLSRNIALEKVLESVHLSCTHANLGCHKSVPYSQRQVHADTCEYGHSSCPIPGCAHKALSGEWREHFLKDHWDKGCNYSYGQSIYMLFNEKKLAEDLYYTLLGPDKDLFLFVNEPILNVGNVLSLYYIDLPHQEHTAFSFELTVYGRHNTMTMQLKLPVISIKKWKRGEVGASSLLVPLGFPAFQYAFQEMKVQVLINKELDK